MLWHFLWRRCYCFTPKRCQSSLLLINNLKNDLYSYNWLMYLWYHKNMIVCTNTCENSLPESNSAPTSLCMVKVKYPSEVTIFILGGGFNISFLSLARPALYLCCKNKNTHSLIASDVFVCLIAARSTWLKCPSVIFKENTDLHHCLPES